MAADEYLDFDYRALTGTFDPARNVIDPGQLHYGLALQIEYVHGFLTSPDGTLAWVEQKFAGALSAGTFVQTDASGEMRVHPITPRTYRGEVRRRRDGVDRSWSDPVMLRLPGGLAQKSDLPYDLQISGASISWDQGELLSLAGESRVLGLQFLCASDAGSILYSTTSYKVTGTCLGEPVTGYVQNDNIFLPLGLEWKETAFFTDKQVAWNIFCNEFEDGSRQFGHLIAGRHGFNAAIVVEDDKVLTSSSDVTTKFALGDNGFARTTEFTTPDTTWRFEGNPRGDMAEFSESRWGGYKAQVGLTQRQGETRTRIGGFSFMDGFLNRVRPDQHL